MDALREKIAGLPPSPGVYVMKDRAGEVLYVGKAIDLRSRVRSYFSRSGDERPFVTLLERGLGDLETVVVSTEKEALLLESELIRRYKPRFNVKLREGGHHFIYLRLDPRQRYPRLEVTRRTRRDGARYFGPYPAARALRETLRVVNRYFKLRTCSDHDASTHQRPCLLCQISRFPAPSVYDIPPEEYARHVRSAILFLEGKRSELVGSLRSRMAEATAALRFEEAARLRDQLFAIERTLEPQQVAVASRVDQDALGLYRDGQRLIAYALYVRHGRVIGGQAFPLGGHDFPEAELVASFVNLYYESGNFVPDEVLLPIEVEGLGPLAEVLSERKGSKVRVLVPRGGARRELVRLSAHNAAEASVPGRRPVPGPVLDRLAGALGLSRPPRRIECFDVSHFQGDQIVASKVAVADGAPDRSRYRRYRIRSVAAQDDFASIYEVVSRRLRRGLEEHDLPDLLVIDGGRGQLASAQAAMKDTGVIGVDVVALAKSRDRAEGPPYEARRRVPERVFVAGRREPIVLPASSPELLLLAHIRDEAHRFAISYQQKLQRRGTVRSALQELPGIGAFRLRALLRHFGSIERVRAASPEDLEQVAGLGPATARSVFEHLHPRPDEGVTAAP